MATNASAADQEAALKSKTFAFWPETPEPLALGETFGVDRDGLRLRAVHFIARR